MTQHLLDLSSSSDEEVVVPPVSVPEAPLTSTVTTSTSEAENVPTVSDSEPADLPLGVETASEELPDKIVPLNRLKMASNRISTPKPKETHIKKVLTKPKSISKKDAAKSARQQQTKPETTPKPAPPATKVKEYIPPMRKDSLRKQLDMGSEPKVDAEPTPSDDPVTDEPSASVTVQGASPVLPSKSTRARKLTLPAPTSAKKAKREPKRQSRRKSQAATEPVVDIPVAVEDETTYVLDKAIASASAFHETVDQTQLKPGSARKKDQEDLQTQLKPAGKSQETADEPRLKPAPSGKLQETEDDSQVKVKSTRKKEQEMMVVAIADKQGATTRKSYRRSLNFKGQPVEPAPTESPVSSLPPPAAIPITVVPVEQPCGKLDFAFIKLTKPPVDPGD